MTLYNINLGIGWASSGVEYAQAYRAKIFRHIKQDAKFIFTDLILTDNIQHMTSSIGFSDDEVIWLYTHFTDVKIAPSSVQAKTILSQIEGKPKQIEREGKLARYTYEDDGKQVICHLTNDTASIVEQVEHIYGGYLLRKDYYSYTKYCSEFYAPKDGAAKLYQRTFYNEDGSIAYDMLVDDNGQEIYRFPEDICYGKQAFIRRFMQSLELSASDIVILDRETGIGQVIFEESQKAHLGIVVHAEHYSKNTTSEDYILWNNYYDYQFTHADKVDFFIVATDRQKDILTQQFARYTPRNPKIVTIPVGALNHLTKPQAFRKPYGLITASRLAEEKHIDWLVEAVIQARKVIPQLTLDIYGSGGTEDKLSGTIKTHGAEAFIRLMGHRDLSQIYSQYQVYVTASTSEGFGLTLMEAVGSGLPIIGFDVPYGNQTFVHDGQNGYLLPAPEHQSQREISQNFADKIEQIFLDDDLADMQSASYDLAKDFLISHVEEKWQSLIEEVLHDSTL